MRAHFSKEVHRATPIGSRSAIRQRIAAVIEGRGFRIFAPFFFSIRQRDTDQLLLCKLTNGKRILLPTSYEKRTSLVVVVRKERNQILADVYSRAMWNKYAKMRGKGEEIEKEDKEVFLVKENNKIYYEAKKIVSLKSEVSKIVKNEISKVTQKRMRGKYIVSWWQRRVDENPESYDTPVDKDGYIHLCSFQGIPMPLLIGSQFSGQKAIVSFKKEERSRFVIVRLKGKKISREFWLVRDGSILNRPVPKYEQVA